MSEFLHTYTKDRLANVSILAGILAATVTAIADDFDTAQRLYGKTRYREALAALESQPSTQFDAALLRGRCYFGLGEFRKAEEAFEAAIRADPKRSTAFHWLGKALGRRAETSSFISAPRLATQCRQNFEKAVALDPRNLLAWNDLLEYSLEAPGFLGGGLDKAQAIAAKIAPLDPTEHHFALARIAEKRNDFRSAERHFRQAAEVAKAEPGRYVDVAKFLVRRGRIPESEIEFDRAAKLNPDSPALLFSRAEVYIRGKRKLTEARQLLQRYLKLELTPDDPPRADAEKLLREASKN